MQKPFQMSPHIGTEISKVGLLHEGKVNLLNSNSYEKLFDVKL